MTVKLTLLTIWRFLRFLTSGGKCSKSLSDKYSARSVSVQTYTIKKKYKRHRIYYPSWKNFPAKISRSGCCRKDRELQSLEKHRILEEGCTGGLWINWECEALASTIMTVVILPRGYWPSSAFLGLSNLRGRVEPLKIAITGLFCESGRLTLDFVVT